MSFRSAALLTSGIALLALSGCTVGPKYQRPQVPVPPAYRGSAQANSTPQNAAPNTASIGAEKWSEVFHDPTLQKLIAEALANNYDIKIAAERVLEEQDQLGVTRAQEYPTLSGGASYDAVGLPASISKALSGNNNNGKSNSGRKNIYAGGLSLSAAWNLDFWGYYRSQTAAARDQLLASTWAQRMTIDTVVEDVATAYFQLRTLDAELAITEKTVAARKQSLQLTQLLEKDGSGTLEDVRQAQESLYQATAEIPDLKRQIAQQEDAISILLGRDPGPILRGSLSSIDWPDPAEVPAGLPLQLLERRPDIAEAEAQLRAAN